MAVNTSKDMTAASGVDALIARLRDDGVSAGRQEADRIVNEARQEAAKIWERANAEAKERIETARRESDSYRAAGEDALKTAVRDTIIEMKSRLMDRFSADLRRMVTKQLKDNETLKKVILEIAGRAGASAGLAEAREVDIVLPENVAGLEELRRDPDELERGRLTQFVLGLTGEMLRDGVGFRASDQLKAGIRVHVKDSDVTIDLSDEAIAQLLLQHLQPRFRAVLEGIVK